MEWSGLDVTASALVDECRDRGWPPLLLSTADKWRTTTSSITSNANHIDQLPPHAAIVLETFDAGQGAKFFQVKKNSMKI